MVNYNNSKIYKIEALNGEEGDIYIGSTTKEYLSQRMDTHRSGYNHWKKTGKKYISSFSIFDKYGIENCNIYLIECVKCNSKDELRTHEGNYIKKFNCVNSVIAGRSKKEYTQDFKEKTDLYQIEYRIKNKDLRDERMNCACGSTYRHGVRTRHFKTQKHLKYLDSINGRSTITTEIIL